MDQKNCFVRQEASAVLHLSIQTQQCPSPNDEERTDCDEFKVAESNKGPIKTIIPCSPEGDSYAQAKCGHPGTYHIELVFLFINFREHVLDADADFPVKHDLSLS